MKIAVYPGTFDPITNGHLDIIERTRKTFDKVIVCIMVNRSKKCLFTCEERMALIEECLYGMHNVEIDFYEGLLVDYVKMKNTNIIVKGMRSFSDFDYEFQMALYNQHLDNEIETFYMITSHKYSYLSSSGVKELAKFQGNVSDFLPQNVENALQKKYEEGCIK